MHSLRLQSSVSYFWTSLSPMLASCLAYASLSDLKSGAGSMWCDGPDITGFCLALLLGRVDKHIDLTLLDWANFRTLVTGLPWISMQQGVMPSKLWSIFKYAAYSNWVSYKGTLFRAPFEFRLLLLLVIKLNWSDWKKGCWL